MDIHSSESKGIKASGYEAVGNKFIVLEGSHAVGDEDIQNSLYDKPKRPKLRQQLIREQKLIKHNNHYQFSEDVVFNSPSEAASIVWGSNLNGKKVFGLEGKVEKGHKVYFDVDSQTAIEGYKLDSELKQVSRDRAIVQTRKEKDDYTCQACGYKLYINGKYIIECHHLHPLMLGERQTTINDLVSLCPTCHRIVHTRLPIYEIIELRHIITANKAN